MKILHYYWTQYDEMEKFGGGIRVYLKNIVSYQKKYNDIYTLNSGTEYDFKSNVHIKYNKSDDGIKQFSIFNSPMLAPSKCSFLNQKIYLEDKKLYKVFLDFIKENGPFDVIHFHSFEGLSLNVLRIKELYPKTKMILTLHNYYPFCPQVNLWKNEMENCNDFNEGKNCRKCISYIPNPKLVRYSYLMNYYLKKIKFDKYSKLLMKKIKYLYNKYKMILSIKNKKNKIIYKENYYYKDFRLKNVEYINKYIDDVICVSNRVKEIAINMGIFSKKCKVLYIGTKFAEMQEKKLKNPINNDILNIIYMGYMRKDKGFYFFINALDKMSNDLAKKINVTIAAKFDDEKVLVIINKLKKKFNHISLYNGYSHEDIKEITKNINLGIVPVLWEDNLPQVAMELKSMGIPILASDRGGASELSLSKYFKFKAGNIEDFNEKIKKIKDNPLLLNNYYEKQIELKTIEEHCKILESFYRN